MYIQSVSTTGETSIMTAAKLLSKRTFTVPGQNNVPALLGRWASSDYLN
jgi:hypothetical protein